MSASGCVCLRQTPQTDTSHEMHTTAVGTHPTGMYSCFREEHTATKTGSPSANVSCSELINDISSLMSANSVVTFKCYATRCNVPPITSMDELAKLLQEFSKTGRGDSSQGWFLLIQHILREYNVHNISIHQKAKYILIISLLTCNSLHCFQIYAINDTNIKE